MITIFLINLRVTDIKSKSDFQFTVITNVSQSDMTEIFHQIADRNSSEFPVHFSLAKIKYEERNDMKR